MKERGIIMSGNNPTLILDGRKTQTRRIVKPQREWGGQPMALWKCESCADSWIWNAPDYPDSKEDEIRCPYGVAGDRFWVREMHWRYGRWVTSGKTKTGRKAWKFSGSKAVQFEKPDNAMMFKQREAAGWYKRSPIHMPRWASRITLELTGVRVERVQEITQADVLREGCLPGDGEYLLHWYRTLWDSLHGKGAWERNDWVWVLDFKLV